MSHMRFIDLFAGIGGFRQGLSSVGAECVFSSEWDKDCQQVYTDNYGERPQGDITMIPASAIPKHDILCAGFPCQAFSISGKRLGFDDTRGTLFFDIARIAAHHTPKVLLLENVKNLLRHDHGKTLAIIKDTLKDLGYSVFQQLMRSSDYGAPQARERIYIVAIRNFDGDFQFPKMANRIKVIDDILLDLSPSEFKSLQILRDDISIYKKEREVLDPRRPHQVGIINKGCQGERIYSRFASGITLSAYGGGAAAKTGAYKIGRRFRKLHPVECLSLQGFPKDLKIPQSTSKAHRLLGNSVTVNVVKAIAKEIKKQVFDSEQIAYQKSA